MKLVRHADRVMLITCLGLFLRAVAAVPCAAALLTEAKGITAALWILLTVLLWIFLVLPQRVAGRLSFRSMLGLETAKTTYLERLGKGLRRAAYGLLFGLPFYVVIGLWYYGYNIVKFKVFYAFIRDLGAFFGGRVDTGVVVIGAVMLLSAAFYAFGWFLYMPDDFLPPQAPLRDARTLLKAHRKAYCLNLLGNLLLLLPSLVLWAYFLIAYAKSSLSWSGGLFSLVQGVSELLKTPMPGSVVLRLLFVLVIVHAPLCAVRKARNAVLTCSFEEADSPAP